MFILAAMLAAPAASDEYRGEFISGAGDARYLRLLDTAAGLFHPNPRLQSLSMLYEPAWNGYVEGPTWDAWWIQNSLGTSYAALPFLAEPAATFLRNSNALWFAHQGDGKRADRNGYVAPVGCLCDAASPQVVHYRQGDGRVDIHDWCVGFTTAGILLEAERLLVTRDPDQVAERLPQLERAAALVETRRDPSNDLFMAGPAGNLLAPSFAGWKRPDGTFGKAYLAEISVNYIAALERLAEVARLAGRQDLVAMHADQARRARRGLARLLTPEGYFVKSIDPDGTLHGVFGAAKHGYFEAVVNHDAIAFDVVDDAQARRICDEIASIPGLRPHNVIITNYPALDDQYEDQGLFAFGPWVNGGHWTTCEARMILAYFRTGRFDDARRSMEHILSFARRFRMDNPLTESGGAVYQPGLPVNTVYDAWGAPAAMLRGLFGYRYTADGLTLRPQIPSRITRLEQAFPVCLGAKRIYLAVKGVGDISGVRINGRVWRDFTPAAVTLRYDRLPDTARVVVLRGGAKPTRARPAVPPAAPEVPAAGDAYWEIGRLARSEVGSGLPLRIGADTQGGSPFHGLIRRVRLFDRPLADAEVAALAADPGGASPAGVRADYRLAGLRDGALANAAGAGLNARVVGQVALEGDAARFDGKGYLNVEPHAGLGLGDAYTLEAWVRPDTTGGRIVDRAIVGGNSEYMLDTYPGNALRLVSDQASLSAPVRLEPGQWAHVAASVDGRGEVRLYLDGRRVAAMPGNPARGPGGADPALLARVGAFWRALDRERLGSTYEARHARLVLDSVAALHRRSELKRAGALAPLPPLSAPAADRLYVETAQKLSAGLKAVVEGYRSNGDARQRRVLRVWERLD